MRKGLIVGVLNERKNEWERRAPLTPSDVKWLVDKGIRVEVESSPIRVFPDSQYKNAGARIVKKTLNASLLVGIKEPLPEEVLEGKIYMLFSHTTKGQPYNLSLLKEFLKKRDTLIDYEKITDFYGRRLVYFGRFAGICGVTDSLYYFGKKLEWKELANPFHGLKPSWKYRSLEELKKEMTRIGRRIRRGMFDWRISPFIIGITGHGNVSRGAQEILGQLNPIEIHPRDMARFIRRQKYERNKIYKIVFLREEKLRARDGKGFYFEEYIHHPGKFESNLDKYLPYLNVLVHTSYWDKRYPRMVSREMLKNLSRSRKFRLRMIGDISCDIRGSIEITHKATTPDNPVYTYDPGKDRYTDGYEADGVTVLAVDNLPAELPRDSSRNFGELIRDYVYQLAAHGVLDVTNHTAIPAELRRAVIAQGKRLTKDYRYLKEYLDR